MNDGDEDEDRKIRPETKASNTVNSLGNHYHISFHCTGVLFIRFALPILFVTFTFSFLSALPALPALPAHSPFASHLTSNLQFS